MGRFLSLGFLMAFLAAQVGYGHDSGKCPQGSTEAKNDHYQFKCKYAYSGSYDFAENPKKCKCLFVNPPPQKVIVKNKCSVGSIPASEPQCESTVSRDARTTPKTKDECQSICDTQFGPHGKEIVIPPGAENHQIACCIPPTPPVKPNNGNN